MSENCWKTTIFFAVLARIIVVFLLWPALTDHIIFNYFGEIESAKKGYQCVERTINAVNPKPLVLVSYGVGYPVKDLGKKPKPVYYEYDIRVDQPDVEQRGHGYGYRVYIDLIKKRVIVVGDDYVSLDVRQCRPFDIPDPSEITEAIQKEFGEGPMSEALKRDPQAVLHMTREFEYDNVPYIGHWEISLGPDEDILADHESYWQGIYSPDNKAIQQETE